MDLQARVDRLERRNRQLVWLAAAALIVLPIGWVVQQARAQSEPAKSSGSETKVGPVEITEQLVLRGANGAKAATLWASAEGSNLTLCDAQGNPRLMLTVGRDGPAVMLLNGDGAASKPLRLALTASSKQGPSVSLMGDDGKPLTVLRAKGGSGQLVITHDKKQFVLPRAQSEDEAAEAAAQPGKTQPTANASAPRG